MSSQRRWLGVFLAPIAWLLQEFLSYFVAAQACANSNRALGPLDASSARLIVALITIATAAAAMWGAFRGWQSWRPAHMDLQAADGSALTDFVALASVTIGVLLAAGILYGGLPLILVDVCARVR